MVKLKIRPGEKDKIIRAIKREPRSATSIAKIAEGARLNANRTRFIVDEMLEEGVLTRKTTKDFNEKYKRYIYEVVK